MPGGGSGARGGVENSRFGMLSWVVPPPGGEKRKRYGYPRLPWSASPPPAAVFPGKRISSRQPLGHRSRRGRPRAPFEQALHWAGPAGGGPGPVLFGPVKVNSGFAQFLSIEKSGVGCFL